MAAQKLFADFPTGGAGVRPMITSDITQKSEEDDASTLAGYKKRLELQRGDARSDAQWRRQMQLQWEQEDKRRAADEMRKLDAQRKEAFEMFYRPQVESDVRRTQENQRTMAGIGNQQIMNTNSMVGKPGVTAGPMQGSHVIPGFGMVGPPMGGPQPDQVQRVLNRMYGQTAVGMQGQNTNPYYSNPYASLANTGQRRGAAGQLL